jgi:glyoxylase-like metal-dependent hydrolase (beta-lactamase superfamily II)
MLIKSFSLGIQGTNCYVVTDEASLECAVIDPGAESNTIMAYLEDNRLSCRYIFLTHGHFDHTGAVDELCAQTGAVVHMSEKDVRDSFAQIGFKYSPPEGTRFVKEGGAFDLGGLRFEILETPGHSQGSICIKCGEALFTGDTLFRDSIGRTDFPGSNQEDMLRSLKKLYELHGDYEVYPGHMEQSSLERERRFNYFMQGI